MIWIIDLVAAAVSVLPPVVRSYTHTVWIKSLLAPLNQLNVIFADFAQDTIRRVAASGQVLELQHTLNAEFDPSNSIYITDGDWLGLPPSVYLKAENQILHIFTQAEIPPRVAVVLYKQAEFFSNTDFVVHAPAANAADVLRMQAWVDSYRVAGRRYKIIFF